MFAAEMEKSTFLYKYPVLGGFVEETLFKVQQVVNDAAKEGMKTRSFNLVQKIPVDIILQGNLDWLLMRNIGFFIRYDSFMDANTQ